MTDDLVYNTKTEEGVEENIEEGIEVDSKGTEEDKEMALERFERLLYGDGDKRDWERFFRKYKYLFDSILSDDTELYCFPSASEFFSETSGIDMVKFNPRFINSLTQVLFNNEFYQMGDNSKIVLIYGYIEKELSKSNSPIRRKTKLFALDGLRKRLVQANIQILSYDEVFKILQNKVFYQMS